MEQNFHYHGTYTAAVMAGFSPEDALVIARAAQYVDDCDGETVQGNSSIFWSNMRDVVPGWEKEILTILDIWPVFHFLPGDFTSIRPYVDPQLLTSTRPCEWMAPKLICGTESRLTRAIVDGARLYYNDSTPPHIQKLQRIGVTMHVLADTFAHQGFAGIPLSLINEATSVRQAEPGGDLRRKLYVFSPAGYSERSFGYLGHGRMGHLPDQPGETFTYCAAWRNQARDGWMIRYNPLEFYCAYIQMTESMEYILGKRTQFSNAVDREYLLDRRRGWPVARHFLEALEEAGSDRKFPAPWYAVVGAVKPPADYKPYDPAADSALRQSFIAVAHDHRDLVTGQCGPLREYRGLFC